MSIVNDFTAINIRLSELDGVPAATEPECEVCESSGWEMYSTGHMDPHFRECERCGNPKGLPSP
jgi:hypothetical protein